MLSKTPIKFCSKPVKRAKMFVVCKDYELKIKTKNTVILFSLFTTSGRSLMVKHRCDKYTSLL